MDGFVTMRKASRLASKFFHDLACLFDDYLESPLEMDKRESKKGKSKSKKEEVKTEEKPIVKTKPKKKKRDKDPNAPKKPLTAFMLYTNNRRPHIKKDNPSIVITDISKRIGAEWSAMTDEKKKSWQEKAKELKVDYEMKLLKYKEISKAEAEVVVTENGS